MIKHIGSFGLLLVAIIWGCGFVATDVALKDLAPLQIMSIRFLIASVLMSLVSIPKLKNTNKKEVLAGVVLGFFLFLGFAAQTIGLKYTTPSKNAFLTAVNVIIVPFIAFVIYKKKVDRYSILGAFLAITGVAVLSLQGNLTLGVGDALTLACAFGFAFQIFFTGEFVKKYSAMVLMTIQMIVAFLLSVITSLLTEGVQLQFSRNSVLSVLFLGVMSTTIAYFLQTVAQKYIDETRAALIMSLEAVFGTIFSVLILKEPVTLRLVVGSIMIFISVLLVETKPAWLFPQRNTYESNTQNGNEA